MEFLDALSASGKPAGKAAVRERFTLSIGGAGSARDPTPTATSRPPSVIPPAIQELLATPPAAPAPTRAPDAPKRPKKSSAAVRAVDDAPAPPTPSKPVESSVATVLTPTASAIVTTTASILTTTTPVPVPVPVAVPTAANGDTKAKTTRKPPVRIGPCAAADHLQDTLRFQCRAIDDLIKTGLSKTINKLAQEECGKATTELLPLRLALKGPDGIYASLGMKTSSNKSDTETEAALRKAVDAWAEDLDSRRLSAEMVEAYEKELAENDDMLKFREGSRPALIAGVKTVVEEFFGRLGSMLRKDHVHYVVSSGRLGRLRNTAGDHKIALDAILSRQGGHHRVDSQRGTVVEQIVYQRLFELDRFIRVVRPRHSPGEKKSLSKAEKEKLAQQNKHITDEFARVQNRLMFGEIEKAVSQRGTPRVEEFAKHLNPEFVASSDFAFWKADPLSHYNIREMERLRASMLNKEQNRRGERVERAKRAAELKASSGGGATSITDETSSKRARKSD